MLRAAVLGGVDGVISSFAVLAGVHAGALGGRAALVVGSSSVLADGLSMGVSEYLSSTAEQATERRPVSPGLLGLTCLGSFVGCGIVPIVAYLITNENLVSCAFFSLTELMVLGSLRTCASRERLLLGLGQTAMLGALAGGVAYGVGVLADLV